MSAAPTTGDRVLTPRFLVLCVGSLGYFLAIGTTWPVIPAFVEHDQGGSGLAVGMSMGAFGVSAAILRPLVGPVGDRKGRRFLVTVGSVLTAASSLLLIPAQSVAAVIGARLVLGAGEAAYFIGVTAAIQDLAPVNRRGEAVSYFTVTLYSGLGIGPTLGEWLDTGGGPDRAFLVAAALFFVPFLLLRAAPGAPADPPAATPVRWRLHGAAVRPGLVLFIGLFGYTGFLAFMDLHAADMGIASSGSVFALFAALIVGVRLFGARLPDRLGALTTTRLSMAFSAAGLFILGVWRSGTGVFVGATVMACGQCFLFPALFVLTVDRAPETERGHAIGSFSVFFDLAMGFGGAVVGMVVALSSRPDAFLFTAGVCAVALMLTGRLIGDIGTPAAGRRDGR